MRLRRLGKKSQSMSISLIVVAVIALLVLVILSYIFVGKISQTRKGMDKCENAGGQCKALCGANERSMTEKECNNDGDDEPNEGALTDGICCISI